MELLHVKEIKKYFKDIKAVDNISFQIEKKGEILGLLGPNGAGKSTTISMISTLIKPDSGTIIYKEKDIIKKTSGYTEKKAGICATRNCIIP